MLVNNIAAVTQALTLEPVLFLYFVSLSLTAMTSQNLLLLKICHKGDSAPSLPAMCPEEEEAQEVVTEIQTWKELIVLVGPVVFVLFAGPWSDSHGKKRLPLIYLPLLGQILSDLLCTLNVYFWSWSPEVTALSGSVLPAITGWRSCFIIGAIAHISDVTTEKSRTVRIGIGVIIYFLATPVGAFMFGMVFHKIGFYGAYILCVVFNSGALVYLFLFVTDKHSNDGENLKWWENLLDPRQVTQSFRTILKKREGYQRAVVLLMISVAPLTMAPLQGEYAVLYFFLRFKFHWNEIDYGYFAAYKLFIIFCGTVVTLGFFSNILKISDIVIGIMSMLTLIVAALGNAFASVTWELFVYPLVDFMHGAGLGVVYSTLSKIVDSAELGQVNGMVAAADALFPLINMPLYNQLYNKTFTRFPGAFFLLSVVYGLISLLIFSIIYILQKKEALDKSGKMSIPEMNLNTE